MEKAILIAIENGWKPFGSILHKNLVEQKWGVPEVYANFYHQPTFLFDPLFWQALGKGLGWEETVCEHCGECWRKKDKCHAYKEIGGVTKGWQYHWHHFIDNLAEGGDIEGFFTNLLK